MFSYNNVNTTLMFLSINQGCKLPNPSIYYSANDLYLSISKVTVHYVYYYDIKS